MKQEIREDGQGSLQDIFNKEAIQAPENVWNGIRKSLFSKSLKGYVYVALSIVLIGVLTLAWNLNQEPTAKTKIAKQSSVRGNNRSVKKGINASRVQNSKINSSKLISESDNTIQQKAHNNVQKSGDKVEAATTVQDNQSKDRNENLEFDVASNPEFLKEGAAVDDFLKPDRIVIGVASQRAEDVLKKLYKPFVLNGHPIISMDIPSAEMTKYAANAMLATKISFMNDIANLCEIMGADVNMVRRGIGSDPRIGNKFIYPGIGYGGSCFPKDVKALIKTAYENGYHMGVLKAVEEVNDKQKSVLFDKVMRHFDGNIKGKTFGMWGLSFKPKTDDMREAPSLVIIEKLLAQGAIVKVHDPVAMKEAKHILGDQVIFCEQQEQAIAGADGLLVVTEWADYRAPDLTELKTSLASPIIFDGRNIFDASEMREHGFTYYGIGIN